jgi:hypothetical protein
MRRLRLTLDSVTRVNQNCALLNNPKDMIDPHGTWAPDAKAPDATVAWALPPPACARTGRPPRALRAFQARADREITEERVIALRELLTDARVDESDLSRRAAEAAEAAASLAAAAERAAAICEELEGTAEALEGRLRVLAVEERALFEAAARAADAPLDEAALLGATSGPESTPVKKVVEVIEFEIPVGFVASIDDVPS